MIFAKLIFVSDRILTIKLRTKAKLYAGQAFPGSAVVAQVPVKHLVVGSNPTRGALRQAQGFYNIIMNRKRDWRYVFGVGKNGELVEPSYPGSPSTSSGLLQYNYDMSWAVYILFCDQKTFYVGVTDNIERRLTQHKRRESFYTKKFSDIKLVYKEEYQKRIVAEKREKQIKKWSIAKKKALINSDKELLKKLSKSREIGDMSLG